MVSSSSEKLVILYIAAVTHNSVRDKVSPSFCCYHGVFSSSFLALPGKTIVSSTAYSMMDHPEDAGNYISQVCLCLLGSLRT